MITPTWYPQPRQLRQFAVIALIGFGLIGLVVLLKTGSRTAADILWFVGAGTFAIGLPAPRAIRPVYALLLAVALPIGWVVSNVLLRAIYYLVFTPIGLFFRLIGRDPLQIRRPQVESYWLDHAGPRDPASYYQQA